MTGRWPTIQLTIQLCVREAYEVLPSTRKGLEYSVSNFLSHLF